MSDSEIQIVALMGDKRSVSHPPKRLPTTIPAPATIITADFISGFI